MKMVRSALMAALAKKIYDEARKPQNQQRIKEAIASVQNRAKSRPGR
jgi:hypothetical protein